MIVPTFSEPPSSPPHCDLFRYPDPAAQPDTNFAAEPTASWTTRADKDVMLQLYSDFCLSRLRKSRIKFLVTKAAASGLALHLSDPAAQAERDEAFRQVRFIRTYTYTSPLSFLPYPFSTLPYPRSHRNTQVAHGGPNPDKRLQIYVTRHIIALDKQHTNTPLA
ncbi:hypothetical protein K438DRAFT_1993652 [Mycena galopus ATCC 62051]|nr:hypothetical protein K438DRAFT_2001522 [Mycena galopus ATCC 62051]KAF8127089.1 hypothetical protein K438DRAFT_2001071 [Mycena galopus ATCC 62051]KAF8143695.1 hypothetical protein K438DRAFT_1993652 [Mycena galopus ATCC 62051]